jgi:UDP-N-acetylmuramoyl-tripeptide--D-alanyl-D-alanine ligase
MIKDILYPIFKTYKKVFTDTRKLEKNAIFFALKGENFNANEFAEEAIKKGASYAIVDEKTKQTNDRIIRVDNVLETLQALATYHREQLGIPVISLTGSNGKTTTKELINAVLSAKYKTTATKGNLNNHIGVPLTLLSMTKDTEIGIVEFGANHPNEITFLCEIAKPDFGYITNFGKAHLEGFGSLEGVIKAKTELYRYLKKRHKTVFVNSNDCIQVDTSKSIKSISFGTKNADYDIKLISANPFVNVEIENTEIESQLIGNYNYNNIAAAIAIGKHFGLQTSNIKTAIEAYKPTNNRSQIIEKGSNKIILDAYNANPSSMVCALDNFMQLTDLKKVAILGDMFEVGQLAKEEHQNMVDMLSESKIDTVYLIGKNFNLSKHNSDKIKQFKTFENFKSDFKNTEYTDTTFLIKASRGMALERVLDLL